MEELFTHKFSNMSDEALSKVNWTVQIRENWLNPSGSYKILTKWKSEKGDLEFGYADTKVSYGFEDLSKLDWQYADEYTDYVYGCSEIKDGMFNSELINVPLIWLVPYID